MTETLAYDIGSIIAYIIVFGGIGTVIYLPIRFFQKRKEKKLRI